MYPTISPTSFSSQKNFITGMPRIPYLDANSCCSSTLILTNLISGYLLAIDSNIGFNLIQYGHHGAQKSAATRFLSDTKVFHSVSRVISKAMFHIHHMTLD